MFYILSCNAKEFFKSMIGLQIIQDDLLSQEIEAYGACEGDQIPLPLQCLQKSITQLTPETVSADTPASLKIATALCMRDMYHYARIRGLHALECVMDAALSLVRKEQIQEACQVCPLVLLLAKSVAKFITYDLILSFNGSVLHLTFHY